MPKGKPASGKRQPGGGRKPLSPELLKRSRTVRMTDAEYIAVKQFLSNLRDRSRPSTFSFVSS